MGAMVFSIFGAKSVYAYHDSNFPHAGLLEGTLPSTSTFGAGYPQLVYVTDNSLFSGGLTFGNGSGLTYTFSSPQSIKSYFLKSAGTNGHIQMFDSAGGVIWDDKTVPFSVIDTSGSVKNFPNVIGNVKSIRYYWTGSSSHVVYELDVYQDIDYTPPTIPGNVHGVTGVNQVSLTWDASTDDKAVAGYNVYRNGVKANNSLITSLAYTDTGLVSDTSYSYEISAVDNSGNESSKSQPINVLSMAPPKKATLSYFSTMTTVSLSWDNVGTSYEVWNHYNGVDYKLFTTSSTSYMITGLSPHSDIELFVVSIDKYGRNVTSDHLIAQTKDPPPPVNPTLSFTSTINSVTLNWNNVGTSYEVWNTFQGTDYKLFTLTGTSYTVTGLNPSSDSVYYVVAIDQYSRRNVSSSLTARTKDLPPPVKLAVQATSDINYVDLSWNSLGSSFSVYQKSTPTDILVTTTGALTYRVQSLTPSTNYSYYVSYVDQFGRSVSSDIVPVTTKQIPAVVIPDLTMNFVGYDNVTFSWNDQQASSYDIYQGNTKVGTVNALTFKDINLNSTTSYDYKIVFTDKYGRVVTSHVLTVKTLDAPQSVLPVLRSVTVTDTAIRIMWNDLSSSNSVSSVDIYRNSVKVGSTSGLFYQDNNLSPSTKYDYTVSYVDKYGRTVVSNVLSLTTLALVPSPTPAPSHASPPPVIHSGNPDLDHSGDHLLQGVGEMKSGGINIFALIIGVVILVFFALWIWRIIKRNMSKVNVSKSGSSGSTSGEKGKGQKAVASASQPSSPKKRFQLDFTSSSNKNTNFKKRKRYSYEKTYQRGKKKN